MGFTVFAEGVVIFSKTQRWSHRREWLNWRDLENVQIASKDVTPNRVRNGNNAAVDLEMRLLFPALHAIMS